MYKGRRVWQGDMAVRNGISLPWDLSMRWPQFVPRGLPLGLIVPGFALNTLFYATVLGLLIPCPLALRRFTRRRRGLCPACGYPMGESDVCTECGSPLVRTCDRGELQSSSPGNPAIPAEDERRELPPSGFDQWTS